MKNVIAKILEKVLDKKGIKLKEEEIEKILETPPSPEFGDYAFPCFFLGEKLKLEPSQIALEIREEIESQPEEFEDIQTSGPYINFFLNRKNITKKLISEILSKKENYCKKKLEKKNRIMIEFSQPNTHKAFHIGHIRGTSIGESLARISEFRGNKVIRANYMGDIGMHVAKWIWCYKKYHSRTKLKKDERWIASIYVDAIKRLEKNKKLQEEVDAINRKISTGEDSDLNSLWKKTKEISLKSFEKIYNEMDTKFNVYFFESDMEKKKIEIIDELMQKKIATVDKGAVIVNLKKHNLGVWVLLRKDETPLYSVKDIALAKVKFSKYKLNESIYLIGAAQSLHMAQLFKTLELMNFPNAKNCKFIPFSEIRLPTEKMSSRTGKNILYSDFMKEMKEYAKEHDLELGAL